MSQISWAVMGCGQIARTFMQSVVKVPNAKVVACAASHIDRAKNFADTHNIEQYYGDYLSMLSQRNIRAVYIATTHNFHFEQIMLCLRHGKHVLCEKPLTLNARQAKQAYDLAKANNLLLIEAVWTRFLPAIRSVKAAIEANKIGSVIGLKSNFSLNLQLPDTHRLKNKRLAGGALLDLGIYPITMADIVFAQMPIKLSSRAIMTGTGVDENSFYTLEYEDGSIAQLSSGFKMSGPIDAVIMGDKGYIHIPHFLGAKEYTLFDEDGIQHHHEFHYEDGENFKYEIEHMTQLIADDICESDILPPATSIRVLKIMDEIRQQWGLRYHDEGEN